MTFSVIKLS